MKYTFLFPYEKIPQGSRIIIYGAGDVGQEYFQQMQMTRYCEVEAFVDRAFDKYPPIIIPIYPVEKIEELNFDYVVLAFKMGLHVRAVTKTLLSMGVTEEKIIYMEPREEVPILVSAKASGRSDTYDYAFLHKGVSIALKYGPGLGDAIVKKKIFMELVRMEPCCRIDVYSPGLGTMIHSLYGDLPNLNEVIDDGGALYVEQRVHYDLAFTVSFMLNVDVVNHTRLQSLSPTFAEKMAQLEKVCKEYNLPGTSVTQRFIHFQRMKFLGLNYYNYLNGTGVFDIRDHCVHIPLDPTYKVVYINLCLPERYITINYGGGVDASSKNNSIAKDWPFDHVKEFVRIFKEAYPHISVVQIGSKGTLQVDGVDLCILGESLELVKYILQGSLIHVDKEGGLVHLATQLGTKCIVCFGPTQEEFFGYEENINIKAGNCHGCYCLYDGFDVCARGLEKPECMWGITAEIVMDKLTAQWKNEL